MDKPKRIRFKRDWLIVIIIYISMRLFIYSVAATIPLEVNISSPKWLDARHLEIGQQFASSPSKADQLLVNRWYRWDTTYFVTISVFGYSEFDRSASFMPLFPLIIRIFNQLTNINPLVLALLISNFFCLIALVLFYEVAMLELKSQSQARDAILYLMVFPSAFFLFVAYSESLILFLGLLMWLLLRHGRIFWASLVVTLAVFVRLQGLALVLPLAWQSLIHLAQIEGLSPKEEVKTGLRIIIQNLQQKRINYGKIFQFTGVVLLPILMLTLYSFGQKAGSLSTVIEAYSYRNTSLIFPWVGLLQFGKKLFTIDYLLEDVIDLLVFIVFISLFIIGLKKIKPGLTFFTLGVLVMVFSRGFTEGLLYGFMRFALTTFPIFLILATIKIPRLLKSSILAISLVTQLILVWLFVHWIWVA
jgi:hypothetical protein